LIQTSSILIINPPFLLSFKILYNYICCAKSRKTIKLENNLDFQRREMLMKTKFEIAEQRKREAFNKAKIS